MPTDLTAFAGMLFANAIAVASVIEAWELGLVNLGMEDAAAEAVLSNGLVSLNDFMALTDEEVTLLIKGIKKPGGADKGQPLPIVIERRLKGFWWFCHFKMVTARDPTVSDMTVSNADGWATRSILMKDPKDAPDDTIDISKHQDNWPKTLRMNKRKGVWGWQEKDYASRRRTSCPRCAEIKKLDVQTQCGFVGRFEV